MKTRVTRRTVLRGLGATIALPYLEIMDGKTAAAASGGNEPARFASFYIPGGINSHTWFPKDTGSDYTIPDAHKPMAHLREHYNVLTNLSHIQGRISGHVHPYNWLTGHDINLTPGAITNSISVDQVAAQHIGQTYLPSLALSWQDGVGTRTLSRNASGVDIPAIGDYRKIFEMLFPPADANGLKDAQARLATDRSVLDTAMASVKDLRRELGYLDQQRLDQYLETIRDVETRLDNREAILERGRPEFDESSVRLEPQGKNSFQEHNELLIDLIVLAFQTDMTRITTHVMGGEGGPNYEEYKAWAKQAGGKLRGAHDFHHKGSNGSGDRPDAKVLFYRDQMLVSCIARFMDKLKSVDAKNGTLLDNTAIIFGGAQTASHVGSSFPLILAGGKALGFKHGQHIRWNRNEREMSDLYLTILQQIGCPVESFKFSKNTISEILA